MASVNIPSGTLVECGNNGCDKITRTFKPIEKFIGTFQCPKCCGMNDYKPCGFCGALCEMKENEFQDIVQHTCHECIKDFYVNHPTKVFCLSNGGYGFSPCDFDGYDFDHNFETCDSSDGLRERFSVKAINAYFDNYHKYGSSAQHDWYYRLKPFPRKDIEDGFKCDAVEYFEYDGVERISINHKMLALYRETLNLKRQNKELSNSLKRHKNKIDNLEGQVKNLKKKINK